MLPSQPIRLRAARHARKPAEQNLEFSVVAAIDDAPILHVRTANPHRRLPPKLLTQVKSRTWRRIACALNLVAPVAIR